MRMLPTLVSAPWQVTGAPGRACSVGFMGGAGVFKSGSSIILSAISDATAVDPSTALRSNHPVLFKREFHAGLASGAITLTFRLWSGPKVKVGGRYRCPPIGLLEVDAVDRIAVTAITEAEAQAAGFSGRDALFAYLRKAAKDDLADDTELFRVRLHFAGPLPQGPPQGVGLSADEVEAIAARLAKMDRLSRKGPWTEETLSLIEGHPKVAASRLAPALVRETRIFKADVRKLKKLGLTLSHGVGYEISPRGREVLAFLRSK